MNYLRKRLPTRDDIQKEDIENCLFDVGTYINQNVGELNNISDVMFESLNQSQVKVQDAIIKLSDVASQLSDIYAITGNSQNSGDPYAPSTKRQSYGVRVDKGTRTMRLDQSYQELRTVQAIRTSQNGGAAGNQVGGKIQYDNPNNLIGGASRFEYEKYNDELLVNVEIELDAIYPVNLIEFTIHNLGVRLPQIASIEMQVDGLEWEYADIHLSGKKNIDLEMFEFENSRVTLHTSVHNAKYIIIKLHQQYPYVVYGTNKTRYGVALSSLRVMQYSAIDSGNVIIGPFEFQDQVLKASVSADVENFQFETGNLKFYISDDAQSWVQVENQKIFNPNGAIQKVIDYNTVSQKSINTISPVFKVWVKVEMVGSEVTKDIVPSDQLLRDVGSISNEERTIDLQSDSDQISVYKSSGFKYGGTVPAIGASTADSYSHIVNIKDDEEQYVKGFNISDPDKKIYDVTKNLQTGNITYSLDKVHVVEKERVYVHPTYDYDPSQIVLFKLQKPFRKRVQVLLKNDVYEVPDHLVVFPVKEAGGIYTLKTSAGSIKVDMKSRQIYSNVQSIYVLPDKVKQVELIDHIGISVGTFKTTTVNGMTCISLLDIFQVQRMSIGERVLNPYYPISQLKENEYAIHDGKLIFGQFYSGQAFVNCVRVQKLSHSTGFGASNKPYIVTDSQMPTRESYIFQRKELVKYIKLFDTNIIEGQIEIDASMANFNPFIKEVKFADGQSEFVFSQTHTQKHNTGMNQITLLSGYTGGELKFYGFKRPFRNRVYQESELVSYGDWYLQEAVYSTQGQMMSPPKILLPKGITTDSVLDVDIEYAIIDRSSSITGQYSVDYQNGIIYSASYIDPNVKVSYLSTNIFARYEALQWVPTTAYSKRDSQVRINDYSDNISGNYVVVQKSAQESSIKLIETPMVKEFKLNVITEREFV